MFLDSSFSTPFFGVLVRPTNRTQTDSMPQQRATKIGPVALGYQHLCERTPPRHWVINTIHTQQRHERHAPWRFLLPLHWICHDYQYYDPLSRQKTCCDVPISVDILVNRSPQSFVVLNSKTQSIMIGIALCTS